MKKHLFATPVWYLAAMMAFNPSLRAQDEEKGDTTENKKTRKSTAIVVSSSGLDDTKVIEKKVVEALDKAGVSSEIKEKVLSQLSVKLAELPELSNTLAIQAEGLKKQADLLKDRARAMTIQLADLDVKSDGEMMTRVMRVVGDQKYRIGVQTSITTTEGEDPDPGVKIEAVFPDTPASDAGVKEGDVILKINDEDLKSVDQLTKTIQVAGKEGKEISLQIKRDDESLEISVKPSEIKEMDSIVENIQMLRSPQSGWVFEAEGGPDKIGIFGAAAVSTDIKKELEEIRNDIREIKKMLKDLKK